MNCCFCCPVEAPECTRDARNKNDKSTKTATEELVTTTHENKAESKTDISQEDGVGGDGIISHHRPMNVVSINTEAHNNEESLLISAISMSPFVQYNNEGNNVPHQQVTKNGGKGSWKFFSFDGDEHVVHGSDEKKTENILLHPEHKGQGSLFQGEVKGPVSFDTTAKSIHSDVNNESREISSSSSKNRSKKPKNINDLDNELLNSLATAIPEATDEERKRFLLARKGDYNGALEQLHSYIAWRKECHLDVDILDLNSPLSYSSRGTDMDDYLSCTSSSGAQDRADWDSAVDAAFNLGESTKNVSKKVIHTNENRIIETNKKRMPQLAHMVTQPGSLTYMKDKHGDRIIQLLPAQIDLGAADEATYALAVALYLDKKLSRTSMEKIVVTIDVRAGAGWANPPAKKIVPFIKGVVSLLERNFPERLSRCILFPLPTAATMLWSMIKVFIDPTTRSKIVVIAGGSGIHDKISYTKFEKILDKGVHRRMEEVRVEHFVAKR